MWQFCAMCTKLPPTDRAVLTTEPRAYRYGTPTRTSGVQPKFCSRNNLSSRMRITSAFFAVLAVLFHSGSGLGAVPVTVDVDASPSAFANATAFPPYWKRSFGSGHARLTLRDDWRAHFRLAVDELGMRGVRHHGMFDDDMGPVVVGKSHDAAPVYSYNFSLLEESWKYQLSLGTKPILEFSFMPAVLAGCTWTSPSTGTVINPGFAPCRSTTMAYKGITELPTEWEAWHDLVVATVRHAVALHGVEEVRTWDMEVWNELWGVSFPDHYMTLYNASATAVKAVDPSLRVGGPATAQVQHVRDFATAADSMGAPYDFVSTHMYPTDPQCPKRIEDGWSPDCFTEHVKAARSSLPNTTPFYLTEYNVGCCLGYSQHDTSAAAAFIFRQVPALAGHVDVLSWWTFTDVFEEGGLPKQEFQDIYGLMTYHGVRKPGWRAFQLLHEHAGKARLAVDVTGDYTRIAPSSAAAAVASATCAADTQLFNATDFMGHDLLPESEHLILPTSSDCCAACANNTACGYWSYGQPGGRLAGRCYLKDKSASLNGKGSHDPFMVSGVDPSRLTQKCVTENATNMQGFDIGSISAADAGVCCAACKTNASCQFWSFKASCSAGSDGGCSGTCYFKSSDAGRTADADFTSGSREDPAPPPPPGTHYQAVSAFATSNGTAPGAAVQVFLSHWANDQDGAGTEPRVATVRVTHSAGGAPVRSTLWRIDGQNANPQGAWKQMGSPAVPTQAQMSELHTASALVPQDAQITAASSTLSTIVVPMPPNSAVLAVFDF